MSDQKHSVLVVVPHYWGKGSSEAEAIKNMPHGAPVSSRGNLTTEARIYHFGPGTTSFGVMNDWGQVGWNGDAPLSVEMVGPRGKRTDVTAEVVGVRS